MKELPESLKKKTFTAGKMYQVINLTGEDVDKELLYASDVLEYLEKDGWRETEKEPPVDQQEVIGLISHNGNTTAMEYNAYHKEFLVANYGTVGSEYLSSKEVTHWRELPKPPKE